VRPRRGTTSSPGPVVGVTRASRIRCRVRRILVTGKSGAGKSTALAELARTGFSVVETDVAPWSGWSEQAGGYVWNEELVCRLLDREQETTLYVSGTVSNQSRFFQRCDAVVLLSAPADVLLRRIKFRTTNDCGKSVDERERILNDISNVEPLLRATCTHEIDATHSVAAVVAELVAIGEGVASGRRPSTQQPTAPASSRPSLSPRATARVPLRLARAAPARRRLGRGAGRPRAPDAASARARCPTRS